MPHKPCRAALRPPQQPPRTGWGPPGLCHLSKPGTATPSKCTPTTKHAAAQTVVVMCCCAVRQGGDANTDHHKQHNRCQLHTAADGCSPQEAGVTVASTPEPLTNTTHSGRTCVPAHTYNLGEALKATTANDPHSSSTYDTQTLTDPL